MWSLSNDPMLKNSIATILEAEKEKNFQSVFKTLWPNLHERLNPPENFQKEIAELEKKKELLNCMVQNEINAYKALAPPQPTPIYPNFYGNMPQPQLQPQFTASVGNHTADSINITIAGLNQAPNNPSYHGHTPINTLSSYNFPQSRSMYSSMYPASDDFMLNSLKESRDKLKYAHKIEMTSDLVDDIVSKVEYLKEDIRKKSTALEIQNEIDKLKMSQENLMSVNRFSRLRLDDDPLYCPRHGSNSSLSHRSRSVERLSYGGDHRQRSSSRNHHSSRRSSRTRSPISILKTTDILETRARPIRKRSVSFHRSLSRSGYDDSDESDYHRRRRRSVSRPSVPDYRYVAPKVNSWNHQNRAKRDQNIY